MPTLTQIRQKVRGVTGTPSTAQLSDAAIDEYIDNYYLYHLPYELSTLRLKEWYQISTIPNQATYPVPEDMLVLEPPVYCGGLEIAWHQSPRSFYQLWLPTKTRSNPLLTGNGGNVYATTLYATPVVAGTVLVGSGPESLIDDGVGGLSSTQGGTGTINYLTGAVTMNFFLPVGAGVAIQAEWQPYVAARPRDILFYNQELVMRPVPDVAYMVQIANVIRPSAMTALDSPLYLDWWEYLALGASLLIFEDRGDLDMRAQYEPIMESKRKVAQRRTLMQLSNQRAPSPYTNAAVNLWPYNLYPGM